MKGMANRITVRHDGRNDSILTEQDANGKVKMIGTIHEVADLSCISDGYHTIAELYDHRITLFIALCKVVDWQEEKRNDEASNVSTTCGVYRPQRIWRSKRHSDGELTFGGEWFVLGIGREKGEQITYHLPISRWNETDFAETLDRAPEWDGHASADVLERLKKL